jgi:hypothetical protein
LIHHDLNVSGSSSNELEINNSYVIDNRADMLSYVMDLANLDQIDNASSSSSSSSNKIKIQPVFDENNVEIRPHPRLAPLLNGYDFKDSSYKKISVAQYRNFVSFTDKLDRTRKTGVEYQKIIRNVFKQIKVTVNNDISSRSILFYDFQVRSHRKDGSTYFTPFVICDLPGKEDLYKTYIEPNDKTVVDPNRKKAILNDLSIDQQTWLGDESKTIKSTYILNPLIMSIFGDNYINIIEYMKTLETMLDPKEIKDIITQFGNDYYYYFKQVPNSSPPNYIGANNFIKDFYKNYDQINTFTQLFDINSLKYSAGELNKQFYFFALSPTREQPNPSALRIHQLFLITMIKILIRKNYLDIIVALIHTLTNWPMDSIYNIWEAYYINENIVGLLHYLVQDILESNTQPFEKQKDLPMLAKIQNNYELSGVFKNFEQQKDNNEKFPIDFQEVKAEKIIVDNEPDFAMKYKIEPNGSFLLKRTDKTLAQFYDTMRIIIYKQNLGLYNSNKIYRDGTIVFDDQKYLKPNPPPNDLSIKNDPILKDFLKPYEQKISFYYLFYLVTNNQKQLKAEEQIKLLNNSMTFINILNSSKNINDKKKQIVKFKKVSDEQIEISGGNFFKVMTYNINSQDASKLPYVTERINNIKNVILIL